MPYTEVQTTQFGRGARFELDLVVQPGAIIAVRNNQYGYGDVQYWGVFLMGDYNLFDGGNVLFNQSVLCYNKAHSLRVPVGYPEAQFPAFYSPDTYRFNVLNLTFFSYAP